VLPYVTLAQKSKCAGLAQEEDGFGSAYIIGVYAVVAGTRHTNPILGTCREKSVINMI
jgi:hypothetical protein